MITNLTFDRFIICYKSFFRMTYKKSRPLLLILICFFVYNTAYSSILGLEVGKSTYDEVITILKANNIKFKSYSYADTGKLFTITIDSKQILSTSFKDRWVTNDTTHLMFDPQNKLYKIDMRIKGTGHEYDILTKALALKYEEDKTFCGFSFAKMGMLKKYSNKTTSITIYMPFFDPRSPFGQQLVPEMEENYYHDINSFMERTYHPDIRLIYMDTNITKNPFFEHINQVMEMHSLNVAKILATKL